MDLLTSSIFEINNSLVKKEISAVEIFQFFLNRIQQLDSKINSYILINEKGTEDAEKIDKKIKNGEHIGLLEGIPIGIKDMICTRGLTTTAGSKILENFVPPYDATLVSRLKKDGAIVLGKLNLDEFAMGSSSETSFFGAVKNPWNTDYVAGGSSGGSAAAQALRLAGATIGTDTGGSIRQPASFCGVVGVKPTYGRVSRYGVVAYASSLDQAGPITTNVSDAAILLQSICGQDVYDSTTSDRPVPEFYRSLNSNVKGFRIGVIKEFSQDGVDEAVQAALTQALSVLKSLGAEIVEVSLPLTQIAVPIYYLIASSEASSNLARYDGVRYGHRSYFPDLSAVDLDQFYSRTRSEGFGKEVQRRIILGNFCLSSGYFDAFYKKACQVRRLLKEQMTAAFAKCDVMVSPVSTTPAFKIGERISDPLQMYLNDIFTVSTNLAGFPGMSLPFQTSKLGLPIGVQITANAFEEQKMLNVAFALEEAAPIERSIPNV